MPRIPSELAASAAFSPAPFWSTADRVTAVYYRGGSRTVLPRLPEKSIHCCVTSPPYWGLRDYQTGTWEGGDEKCDHKLRREGANRKQLLSTTLRGGKKTVGHRQAVWVGGVCGRCGARKVDQQLGSEPSPDCLAWAKEGKGWRTCGACFVCNLVAVFREARRVLRDDGVLWLNLGDTYSGPKGNTRGDKVGGGKARGEMLFSELGKQDSSGLPSGNLVGVPWRVALALQADGWVLRSDVPWFKRSAMPESVTNRPAKALEYVFMLVKGKGYYFDMEAVRRESQDKLKREYQQGYRATWKQGESGSKHTGRIEEEGGKKFGCPSNGRNFRNADLWFESIQEPYGLVSVEDELVGLDVTSGGGYGGNHFATYSKNLITPLIKAGTSQQGCCAACGAPWQRVVQSEKLTRERPNDFTKRTGEKGTGNVCANSVAGVRTTTVGWEKTCSCDGELVVPCTVLDPFLGAGTTAVVCKELGRRCVGVELSEAYLREHAVPRYAGPERCCPACEGAGCRRCGGLGLLGGFGGYS